MADQQPSREEMIAALQAQGITPDSAPQAGLPSREEMIAQLQARGIGQPPQTDQETPGLFDSDGWYKKLDALNAEDYNKSFADRVADLPKAIGYRVMAVPGTELKAARKLADYIGRGADYGAGLVRTGVGGLLGLTDMDDLKKALSGQAPRTVELMDRGGVPEGPNVNIPWVGSISARDAAGFAGDIASDPLTYFGGPLNHLGGQAVEDAGTTMYKSGLKRVDQEVAKYGKEPVSDLLMKNRVTGSMRSIADQMDQMAEARLAARNKILQDATNAGAEVDMNRAVQPAQEYVDKLTAINNPEQEKAITTMQNRVNDYQGRNAKTVLKQAPEVPGYVAEGEKAAASMAPGDYIGQSQSGQYLYSPHGPIAPAQAEAVIENPIDKIISLPVQGQETRVSGPTPLQTSAWKTTAANRLSDSDWQQLALTNEGKTFDRALAKGLRGATEDSVGNALGEDAKNRLSQYNDELGRLLTSQDRAERDAAIEANKNNFTSVDGMIAGTHAWPMLLVKKAADVAKMTYPRTAGGLLLKDIGQTRIPDVLLRRAYIDQTNPWTQMQGQGGNQ